MKLNKKRKNKLRAVQKNFFDEYGFLLYACMYILLYEMFSNEAVKIVLSIVYIGVLCMLSDEKSFFSCMFIMCGNEALGVGATSSITIFTAIYFVKNIYMGIIFKKEYRILYVLYICYLLLLVIGIYELINDSKWQLILAIKAGLVLFFLSNILRNWQQEKIVLFTKSFRIIALGINYYACVSLVTNGIPSLNTRYTISPEVTINSLGILCAICVVCLFYNGIVLKKNKLLEWILIMGCSTCGLLTQSRSFILAVAIGVVLIFVLSSSIKMKIGILSIIVIITVSMFFVNSIFETPMMTVINNAINRIIDPKDGDVSNGRYDIWRETIENMKEDTHKVLFGAGDYSRVNVIAGKSERAIMAHNMFIESWVIYGIIGCFLWVVILISFIKEFIYKKRKFSFSLVSAVPVVVMFCALFYSHHFIGKSTMMVFVLLFIPMIKSDDNIRGNYSVKKEKSNI